MLKGLAFASFIYAAGSFASKFAKFLLIPIYVRFLSPDEVGTVVFLEALILACSSLFPLGLGQAVKRFYLDFPERSLADSYTNTLWIISIGTAVVGALLLSAIAGFAPWLISADIPATLVILAIIAGAVRTSRSLPMQRFIARGEALKHGLFSLGEFLTTTGLIIVLVVVFDQGVYGVMLGQIASYVTWALIYGLMLGKSANPYAHTGHLLESLRYSLPLLPHMLFTWAITFADRIILVRFVSLSTLGVYGIGYQLASVMPVLSLAMVNAWLPRYFKDGNANKGGLEFCRIFCIFCTILMVVATTLYFGAPEIIMLAATEQYADAVPIFKIVVVGLVFHGVYQAILLVLFFSKEGARVSMGTGLALAVNLMIIFLFVPGYGIVAAAWATVAAYLTASIYTFWMARDRLLGASRSDLQLGLAPVATGVICLGVAHFLVPPEANLSTRLVLCIGIVLMTATSGFVVQRKIEGRTRLLTDDGDAAD
jgi:O-antigen/teichoic acid export membrane protein